LLRVLILSFKHCSWRSRA